MMKTYPTLQALLDHDPRSRSLFDSLPTDVQVALQEQRQSIGSYDALRQLANGFQQRESNR